ncbi:MAG: recombination mediator RecR [Candidatus Anaerobiospirillum pullicola]|uniref:Recombination protein RecR n=1 Tax=Candidatus Anaerobiospirillum pullicola TaxID=2838451 RepID=A0A948TG37_9GAMM|nr:recombination mediator RecR [Candidatus Anaerobiospirillum pullicola]
MSASTHLDRLIQALQIQPGVGPRAAARIAYYLLGRRREDAQALGQILIDAMDKIQLCSCCRNYCDDEVCALCSDPKRRESGQLCVVESPADVAAIEQSQNYKGRYFVLHGHLSPIDGIGANELGLPLLDGILATGNVTELILATNPTIEGDATAAYIAQLAKRYEVGTITKIASGVPLGGALDNIDQKTLLNAIANRRPWE